LHIFEEAWDPEFIACGTPAFIVGLYHSWSLSTTWSQVIRRIKLDYEVDLIPVTSRIAADFMCERTGLAETADILVPVPPSPGKYGKRGFAPTDLMAAEVSRVLAIPTRMALGRKPGVPTREATYTELLAQFYLDESRARDLHDRNIVLIEDVVTTGQTVSVCVQKLQAVRPASVNVLALAKGIRR
jgi:predicted amidophosphoribosyltransferase